MSDGSEAIETLQELGLTEYESKCFVALTHRPQATARDLSRVADVPRSRIYGAMDRLHRKGLVDVQRSEPKVYRAVEIDTALRILRKRYDAYFESVETSLRDIEPTYKEVDRGVWAIEGYENVTARTLAMIEGAEDEVVLLLLHENVLDEEVAARLREAIENGVDVHVGTVIDGIRAEIEERAPGATVFGSELIEWLSTTAESQAIGRLLMVDDDAVLTSAVFREVIPGYPEETAAWSTGIDHGFAIFVREILRREAKRSAAEATK
ncbi:TrmB family transcriptional regulator [Halegenticoccus tardaugens]|uniref:TrmB family transcriptional regulator n=1 Tax=Halegenticoccus tardaugens TaxID=2071624 RepID=UPI00100A4536|nr:helix-turn-helix domain-containing protein [Halegenticoccus tardaugens]